jgi:NADH-quinone oxidoreductase subunit E
MSDNSAKLIHQFVSENGVRQIDEWVAKYPANKKQSAVMQVLMIIQEENGYLTSEAMDAVAEYLGMDPIAVYQVASFYSMYKTQPTGRHLVNVCTNISCQLRNSAEVLRHLEKKLDIKSGETTKDGRFTLQTVECLGACVNAPMMQVDKDYHENLTPEKIDAALEQYS